MWINCYNLTIHQHSGLDCNNCEQKLLTNIENHLTLQVILVQISRGPYETRFLFSLLLLFLQILFDKFFYFVLLFNNSLQEMFSCEKEAT